MPEHLFAVRGEALLSALMAVGPAVGAADVPLPDYVADFLVRLRLGEGVPFGYLVPDPALLPDNAIRFFTVDEAWLDVLLTGALAVGSASTRDTDHATSAVPAITQATREALPLVAAVRRCQRAAVDVAAHVRAAIAHAGAEAVVRAGAEADVLPDIGGTPPVTGFLLRSGLVSGWPGMNVRAFTTSDIPEQADPSSVDPSLVVPILRMETLAPSILLVLFAGSPAMIWLEEPHHGIQLGVDPGNTVTLVTSSGSEVTHLDGHGEDVPETAAVPMRGGQVAGVVDVQGLVANLASAHAADPRVAPQGGSAALALQLLRPPVRQRFATDENA